MYVSRCEVRPCMRFRCGWVRVRGSTPKNLTETFDGKLLIRDVFPLIKLLSLHCSWLYSTILSPQSRSRINSTMRSSNFLDARLAGEKITISSEHERARAATKIAIEKVFPKRRGVETRIWLGQSFHWLRFIIAGFAMLQSERYITREHARIKAS